MTRNLPPDPQNLNDERAACADAALNTFRGCTRTDVEDALADLLADLLHWSDRNDEDFDAALARARLNYRAETEGE
jgi:hypothetical protein